MKKLLRSLALASVVAMGTATLVSITPAVAQTQKDKVKEAPKDKGKETPKDKPAAKGSVTYKKDKAGEYRFFIKDENGKTLAMSPVGYEKPEDAIKAIEAVKSLLNTQKPVEEK